MRKTFPGHYRLTDDEFSALWDTCLFVVDANVLVDISAAPQAERSKELLRIFNRVSDRLWLPHQVALEYQEVRLRKVIEQEDGYNAACDCIEKTISTFAKYHNPFEERWGEHLEDYPELTEVKGLLEGVEQDLQEALGKVREAWDSGQALFDYGEIGDRIAAIFEGKIGHPYTSEELEKIYTEGARRYPQKIPPGYEDEGKKDEARRYGDLVLWFQMIEKAQETCKPLILVSGDQKEDWFQKRRGGKGAIIGPRPELANEMAFKANVSFYLYGTTRFMQEAKRYLEMDIAEKAIEESRQEDKLRAEQVALVESFEHMISSFSPLPSSPAYSLLIVREIIDRLGQGLSRLSPAEQAGVWRMLEQSHAQWEARQAATRDAFEQFLWHRMVQGQITPEERLTSDQDNVGEISPDAGADSEDETRSQPEQAPDESDDAAAPSENEGAN